MAVIHKTTMNPGKLDLLAAWLPAQPWYLGAGRRRPELTRAGGFRLDDPAGEVGIEFMVAADTASGDAVFYHVPMTYRGHPLPGADGALIGTSEHGVLGTRWIYDGVHDPVLVAALRACIMGEATPQAQSVSDTPDPTVIATPPPGAGPAAQLGLRVNRVLLADGAGSGEPGGHPCVSATWRMPDGTQARGVFVSAEGFPQ